MHEDLLVYYECVDIPAAHLNLAYLLDIHTHWGLSMGIGLNVDPKDPKKNLQWNTIDTSFSGRDTTYDTNSYFGVGRTKFSTHLSFDLKRILPSGIISQALGEQDLKIYGEAAILGYRYFDGAKIAPFAFGFNVPGFKILWDVLSVELEYFKMNAQGLTYTFSIDDQSMHSIEKLVESDTPWRWSVFCSRTIVSKLKVLLLVARDHYNSIPLSYDLESKGSWHWVLKLRYDL